MTSTLRNCLFIGVEARLRKVQRLVELRSRSISSVTTSMQPRGAKDPDAVRQAAHAGR